ncbi:UNVERIFIED_CONTAM: hypothetical protein K2H54_070491 [Gekko kuhli]
MCRPRDFPHSPRTTPNPNAHQGQTREPPDEDPTKQRAQGTANARDEEETRCRPLWWLRHRAAQGPTPGFGDERNTVAPPGAPGEPDNVTDLQMERRNVFLLILNALSAAFDMVDCNILLENSEHISEIPGTNL